MLADYAKTPDHECMSQFDEPLAALNDFPKLSFLVQ